MSKETHSEQIDRVRLMAEGDETWDLSGNDCAALKALLLDRQVLLSLLKRVMDGFECGIFVRDVTRDGERDWAIKLLPFLKLLSEAKAAIARSEQ